jgi:hypothetical protein
LRNSTKTNIVNVHQPLLLLGYLQTLDCWHFDKLLTTFKVAMNCSGLNLNLILDRGLWKRKNVYKTIFSIFKVILEKTVNFKIINGVFILTSMYYVTLLPFWRTDLFKEGSGQNSHKLIAGKRSNVSSVLSRIKRLTESRSPFGGHFVMSY